MQAHCQQFIKNRLILAFGVLALASSAWASDGLPAGKTVRIIVPYAPGGTSDILGRKLAQGLQDKLGHTVIVGEQSRGRWCHRHRGHRAWRRRWHGHPVAQRRD